jgi:hypothetical protein
MTSYTAQSREAERAPLPMDARRDRWWVQPLLTVVFLGLFGVYTTFRAFENDFYRWGPYLSPFYSPLLPIAWRLNLPVFGERMVSPALFILIFPLAFRLTCYYYRKAYYRAFMGDPPACAVAEPKAESRMKYTGERAFPFLLQNLHRFAFYAIVVVMIFLWKDTVEAFIWHTEDGAAHFGIGLGSLVFLVNVVMLSVYTFSCHSWRHLIGGNATCYSCSNLSRTKYGLWKQVSYLNGRHAMWAWISMFTVWFADLYVRLVAAGTIPDPHVIF